MNIVKQLKDVGLHQSEIDVYLYLLGNGYSTPPQVSRGTKIARTNCYNVLSSLKDKGLIKEEQRRKRKVYLASDPEALLLSLEKKKMALEGVIPDLKALFITQKNKPQVKFYDGWEEVKEIYLKSLEAEEIRMIGSTQRFVEIDQKFSDRYWRDLQDKKIIVKEIIDEKSVSYSLDFRKIAGNLHEYKTLPAKYAGDPTDILLWGDSVALINLEQPAFGTVLTNKALVATFRMIFDMMWQSSG